ncbi:hypothetical protein [Vibrio coralliilyticus]|uniref:hypothetical protein n=1 Tax=Vibrio coralliilyticus TaxID=190893 RepID=UPI001E55F73F|nr:hypothetical protein [Vibrio coralliilyticus]MCC2525030.1 hypothetical protein [Vibrio coralliilyticus]
MELFEPGAHLLSLETETPSKNAKVTLATGTKDHDFLQCRRNAFKYRYRSDFQNNERKYYNMARVNGWLDDVCKHMPIKRKAYKPEELKEIARQFVYLSDFAANQPHFYQMTLDMEVEEYVLVGLVRNEFLNFDIINAVTLENVISKSRYCTSEKEFAAKHMNEQVAMRINGWFDNAFAHLTIKNVSLEQCLSLALCYSDRLEVKRYAPKIFNRIKKMKWSDVCFAHCVSNGFKYT